MIAPDGRLQLYHHTAPLVRTTRGRLFHHVELRRSPKPSARVVIRHVAATLYADNVTDTALRRQINDVFIERGMIVFEDVVPSDRMQIALSEIFGPPQAMHARAR